MTSLAFEVLDVAPERYAAVPTLVFRMRATARDAEPVHALALRCQIRIEPQRRRYDAGEQQALYDLFGEPDRWGSTLKPLLWTHVSTMLPGFEGSIEFDLPVTCTYDLEVAATKYFAALDAGTIPLLLLFSGTVFTRGDSGFSVQQLSWDLEARHGMPVATWRELIDGHFPASAWIRLHRDTLDALRHVKRERGLATWDSVVGALVESAREVSA